MKKKGDLLKIKSFEAIHINDVGYLEHHNSDGSLKKKPTLKVNGVRCSIKLKDGTKYWAIIPLELIESREARK